MTASHTIACPACGGTVAVRAAGYTVTLACRYCGALLDVANPDVRLIADYAEAVAQLALPLGSQGVLDGVTWEAIGWQEREGSDASWTEYLLFNPYAGYRWLVHADGQWLFGTMLVEQPHRIADDVVVWRGRTYHLCDAPDRIVTTRVLGEFYWRVQAGDTVDAAEYADGDAILSLEQSGDEINWTSLVALRPGAVRGAFTRPADDRGEAGDGTPSGDAPEPAWIGWWDRWNELPSDSDSDLQQMVLIAIAALLIICGGMLLLGRVAQSLDSTLTVAVDGAPVEKTLGTIAVQRASQAVRLRAVTDPDFVNAWIDIDYALVNRATQQAIRAEATIERYAGTDSDGRWSEGSTIARVSLARVPRGTYDVIAQAQAHHWTDPKTATGPGAGWDSVQNGTHQVALVTEVGGMEWGLFWIVLVLIVIPPAIVAYGVAKRGSLD